MRSKITREGIYYSFVVAVILAGSILREINPMLLFSAFLCAPLIIAWRLGRRSLRKIHIRRRLPSRVFAGEPFIVYLEATNPRPKSWRSLSSWGTVVVDRIRPIGSENVNQRNESPPYEPAVYFEYIPNEGTVRKTYSGRLPQRGRYRIGPAVVSTRFPFGFFRHGFEQKVAEDEKTEFCVFPKLGRISAKWRTRQHEAVESQQRHRFRPSRVSGEFLGVRKWQRGDAKKWIHWRASIKHGQLFVRQFEKNQNRDCAILIDLSVDDAERQVEDFELAVSFTATLVSELTRRGGCNLFFTTSRTEEEYLAGPVCLPLVESVLQKLALVAPDHQDDLPETLLKTLSLIDANADLILVTPQSLDLAASSRFHRIRNDPRFRVLLQRLRIIDTSNPELDEFFSFEELTK